jgi:hypothetical protein
MRCAVIDKAGNVVNIIMANPVVDKVKKHRLVTIPDNLSIGVGWTWTPEGGFVDPRTVKAF